MDYQIYLLIAPATLLLLFLVLWRTWGFRANHQASILLLAIILNIGWLAVNYLELAIDQPAAKITFAKSSYLFSGTICLAWFAFALRYTGLDRLLTRRNILLAALPWLAAIFLVFSNELHQLIWQTFLIIPVGNDVFALRVTQYGPAFWPVILYLLLLVLLGFALLLNKFLRSSPLFRRQTIWILVGASLPLAFNLFYLLRIFPNLNKDYTSVSFGLSVILVVIAILRFHLFQLAPVARETLVDQMGDGMLVLDYSRHVVDHNPSAGQLLGLPIHLTGFTPSQLFPGLPDINEHLPQQTNLPVQLQYQTEAGRVLKLRIWGLSDRADQASGWLIILEDVSAAQKALAELRKSEELFRSVVHSAREGVTVIDLQGQITYASPRMAEMYACSSSQEMTGRQIFEFIAPQDVPRAASSFQKILAGEKLPAEVIQNHRKDGSVFFGEILSALLHGQDGAAYGVVLLVRDITARRQAEAERIRMAQILQSVIDNEHIILTSSDPQRNMLLWNKGAEKITGISSSEAIENPEIYEICYPSVEYRQKMAQLRSRVQAGEDLREQIELVTRQGEKKYVVMFSRSLRDEQDRPIGNVNLGLDITPRIQAEQAMQAMTTSLEEIVTQRTTELRATVSQLEEEIHARRLAEDKLVAAQESLGNQLVEQSRQLAALYEVILTGGLSLEWQELQNALLEKILAVTNADAGAIYQGSPKDQSMSLMVKRGLPPEVDADVQTLRVASPAQLACPVIPGLEACLSAPIHLRGAITGALILWREGSRLFSIEDLAISNALADQAGIILENARLSELIQEAAVQEERRRLARDLHDSVTQSLHSLTLMTEVALNRLQQNHLDKLEGSLHQIVESSRQALKEMRLLLYESLQPASESLSLAEMLSLRLESVEQRSGLQTELVIGKPASWSAEWEPQMLAIAIEALNNALKYARASQVSIHLRGEHDWCEMNIQDNGIGFDPESIPVGGIGLLSMRERANALGGKLEVQSVPEQGTRVRFTIGPVPKTPAKRGKKS